MDLAQVFDTPLQFGDVSSAEKVDQFLKLYDAVAQVNMKRVLVDVVKQDGSKQTFALGFYFSKACRNRGVSEGDISDDYIKRLMAVECLIHDADEHLFQEFTVTRTHPNTTSIRIVPVHKSEQEIYSEMIDSVEDFLKKSMDSIGMMKHVLTRRGTLNHAEQAKVRKLHGNLIACEG